MFTKRVKILFLTSDFGLDFLHIFYLISFLDIPCRFLIGCGVIFLLRFFLQSFISGRAIRAASDDEEAANGGLFKNNTKQQIYAITLNTRMNDLTHSCLLARLTKGSCKNNFT